jgi:hypothetical protein
VTGGGNVASLMSSLTDSTQNVEFDNVTVSKADATASLIGAGTSLFLLFSFYFLLLFCFFFWFLLKERWR